MMVVRPFTKSNTVLSVELNSDIDRLRNIPAPPFSKDIFSDLLNVGVRKSVGYLPLSTIEKYGDADTIFDLITWADENKLNCKSIFTGTTASGAFYVWDCKMLRPLLDKHKEVLVDAGIPLNCYHYVDHIEHVLVPKELYPEAYKVIGLTFADKRFK